MASVWILYVHNYSSIAPTIHKIYDYRPSKRELEDKEAELDRFGLNCHIKRYTISKKRIVDAKPNTKRGTKKSRRRV